MRIWNDIDARDYLEHLMNSAIDGTPQYIQPLFGRGTVVMLEAGEYERLVKGAAAPAGNAESDASPVGEGDELADPEAG